MNCLAVDSDTYVYNLLVTSALLAVSLVAVSLVLVGVVVGTFTVAGFFTGVEGFWATDCGFDWLPTTDDRLGGLYALQQQQNYYYRRQDNNYGWSRLTLKAILWFNIPLDSIGHFGDDIFTGPMNDATNSSRLLKESGWLVNGHLDSCQSHQVHLTMLQ